MTSAQALERPLLSFILSFVFLHNLLSAKPAAEGERLSFLPSIECYLSWKWFSLISAANGIMSLTSYFRESLSVSQRVGHLCEDYWHPDTLLYPLSSNGFDFHVH